MTDKAWTLMEAIETTAIEILRAKIQLDADLNSDIESDTHVYELYEAIDNMTEHKRQLLEIE